MSSELKCPGQLDLATLILTAIAIVTQSLRCKTALKTSKLTSGNDAYKNLTWKRKHKRDREHRRDTKFIKRY